MAGWWVRAVARVAGPMVLLLAVQVPAPRMVATANHGYDTSVDQASPWPTMRHDRRNTGASDVVAHYAGDHPWYFHTGRGIFSTPVLGGDGTVYVGSADRYFYAIKPDGSLKWKFETGNIIDSAGFVGAYDPVLQTNPVTFGSADEYLYHLRTDAAALTPQQRTIWKFRAALPPSGGQLVDWWEGNAEAGLNGTILAGNTAGYGFAINPDGSRKWDFAAGNSVWTDAAVDSSGNTYWGSLDRYVYAINPSGRQIWRTMTAGFLISSPALGIDGTLYVGSFDSKFYALDSRTGLPKWTFQTREHIYSSPALDEDAQGNTRAVYLASTDGSVYALKPDGSLLWQYETGDVVRASPALGMAPDGGRILYIGAADGRLYALDARTGIRRWSYDTTSTDPILRDRNDLNASPVLGAAGIYIAGEDGDVVYVPYDYCLHVPDPRCSTNPGQGFGDNLSRVLPITSGGSTEQRGLAYQVPASAVVNGRLVVRARGSTVDAAMEPLSQTESLISTSPSFPFTAELSGNGHYVYVNPTGFLQPDTDYKIAFAGTYLGNGPRVADYTVGGTPGRFADSFTFHTAPARLSRPPLTVTGDSVTAFTIKRLAVPLPPFLPSVNQIGFDSYDWIVGTLGISAPDAGNRGSLLLWVIGTPANGIEEADPKRSFSFPLSGRYLDDFLSMSQRNLTLTFSFGSVPLDLLQFRGQMDADHHMQPGASLYAEAQCAQVPNYGPLLFLAGLCNQRDKVVASGTYITDPFPSTGTANRRPPGVSVTSMMLQEPTTISPGSATATFNVAPGFAYPAAKHLPSLLLVDAVSGEPVAVNYQGNTTSRADTAGNVASVTVTLPAGTAMPRSLRAYVISDVFPLGCAFFNGSASLPAGPCAPGGASTSGVGGGNRAELAAGELPVTRPAPGNGLASQLAGAGALLIFLVPAAVRRRSHPARSAD